METCYTFLKTSISETSSKKIHQIALYCDTNLKIYEIIIYHLHKSSNLLLLNQYQKRKSICISILENITNNKNSISSSIDIAAKYGCMITHANANTETIHKQVLYHLRDNDFNTYIIAALENENTSNETLREIMKYPQYQHKVVLHRNYTK